MRRQRGADRQHAGICLPKSQPHVIRTHRVRRTGIRPDQPAAPKPEEIREEVHTGAAKSSNLAGKEKDPPLALSFGQQKRVSIAAVLAMRSRILVMDEPTAGQDYQNYMNFMDAILQMPGFEAILFITHDVDLAVIYANRVLLMGDGQVVADGPPQEALADFDAPDGLPVSLPRCYGQPARPAAHRRFLRAEALAHI